MRYEEKIDHLLGHALTQKAEPDAYLQQRVLHQWKEKKEMRNSRKWAAAMAVIACVFAVTVSVGATGRYLNSRQVAENFGFESMAKAFSEKDAIVVNETKAYGDYQVTMLGMTSGKNLSGTHMSNGQLIDDMTYAVVAIERTDGTPMPDGTGDLDDESAMEFFVSPFVRGLNPVNYNLMTMNGGYTWDVIDGVRYQIAECDNVECFADRGLYLCVMNDMFYNNAAYNFDSKTGEITANADYGKMNLLFDLPIDAAHANTEKAKQYLDTFEVPFPNVE